MGLRSPVSWSSRRPTAHITASHVTAQISLHRAVLPTRCRQTIREIERLQRLAGACCDCRAADTPTGSIYEYAEGPKRSEGEVTSRP
jgi:hypothetical protein